ncbi:MAG: YbaB/EbfC family nucleoid-associated protein [bacterium]
MFEGNLSDLLRKAQEMGQNLKEKQDQLARREFEVSVGGEAVKMRFNGKGEAISIAFQPGIIESGDVGMLEDLVLSAVNEGVRRSQQMMQEEMSKLAGGLKIPGLTQ